MFITINGTKQQVSDDLTIAQLLIHLALENQRLAIEINGEIISRSDFEHYQIKANDKLEIVRAIGGG